MAVPEIAPGTCGSPIGSGQVPQPPIHFSWSIIWDDFSITVATNDQPNGWSLTLNGYGPPLPPNNFRQMVFTVCVPTDADFGNYHVATYSSNPIVQVDPAYFIVGGDTIIKCDPGPCGCGP
jgi:hypothetical protein